MKCPQYSKSNYYRAFCPVICHIRYLDLVTACVKNTITGSRLDVVFTMSTILK